MPNFIEEAPEYNIYLINIDMERLVRKYPEEMSISLTIEKSDIEIINNAKTNILVSANFVSKAKEEDKKLFSLRVVYIVELMFYEELYEKEKKEIDINLAERYSLFILYPQLRDTVNRLFNNIGLPDVNIPFKAMGINDN